jgi:N-methylhydantoinase A
MIRDRKLIVGVDTGGTFTDLVAVDDEGSIVYSTKVSTTPDDPSTAILEALPRTLIGDIEAVLHGTTTGTNAVLERRGARTALLTTRGFRDVLELARQDRPHLYDWFHQKPEPLVSREFCFEIDERQAPNEDARRPLNERQARSVVGELATLGIESVAVSLLHAYQDDRHERRLRELIQEQLPDARISLSSEVLPEIMEYERTSTTVANAYLAPVMERYLERLISGLRALSITAPVYIMQSDGGLGAAATIARRAVQTVLSGPAAGVIGGLASTTASTKSNFLTIDMGGTSFDIAYAEDRRALVSRESRIDGLPLAVAALDIHTLGAGGGSIAWIDGGGALRVGPMSAGSQPGPACYGRGGLTPTVTDANVVLGRLGTGLLGGRLVLDADAARQAIESGVATPLGLSAVDAARGIIEVVNAAMAKGMRLMSVARGRDPRTLGIVGFGGAGPLHACELAAALGSSEVIIPLLPGNTSALGLALARIRRERSQAVIEPIEDLEDRDVAALLEQLAARVVLGLGEDGVAPEAIELDAVARVCYEGQRYQLDVPIAMQRPWTPGTAFPGTLRDVASRFEQDHRIAYGYTRKEPISLFAVAVIAVAPVGPGGVSHLQAQGEPPASPPATRSVWFSGGFRETPVLERQELRSGSFEGPAVIEQPDSTTLVPPGWSGVVDSNGNLILRLR